MKSELCNVSKLTYWLSIANAIAFGALLVIIITNTSKQTTKRASSEEFACGKHTFGAEDPVSDPEYNMKNIAKQSILLEEHLAEDRKYCKDCCVKHFLHIIGLAEEALWLAGNDHAKYPYLKDSVEFYNAQFEKWNADKESEDVRRNVLTELREWRKRITSSYF